MPLARVYTLAHVPTMKLKCMHTRMLSCAGLVLGRYLVSPHHPMHPAAPLAATAPAMRQGPSSAGSGGGERASVGVSRMASAASGARQDTASEVFGPQSPAPAVDMQGLPEVRTGARGLARKQQEQRLIEAVHWRFIGKDPPPCSGDAGSSAPASAVSQPGGDDGAGRADVGECIMWAQDMKRQQGHSLRHVMLRFSGSGVRHKQEVRRLRALAGDDACGESWPSCSTSELAHCEVVSVVLDHAMSLAGPAVHMLVLPAPEQILAWRLASLRAAGLSRELVTVVEELTRAVDLVHSRNLVMLSSLNRHAFGMLNGRWVLHDLADVRETGAVLTRENWSPHLVMAPEAQALAAGEEDQLAAHASIDMFLLGLIIYEVFVGKPLAPDTPALIRLLGRMRADDSDSDFAIGTGRCPDQVCA